MTVTVVDDLVLTDTPSLSKNFAAADNMSLLESLLGTFGFRLQASCREVSDPSRRRLAC